VGAYSENAKVVADLKQGCEKTVEKK